MFSQDRTDQDVSSSLLKKRDAAAGLKVVVLFSGSTNATAFYGKSVQTCLAITLLPSSNRVHKRTES
jgi:hypothetical protein